jgi:O-antigen/teichoic acid export membrane protein
MLVIDVANMMGYEAIKWVIGAELSVLDTGAYVIIALLASTAGSMVRGIANVLLPVASKYEALERRETNSHLALLSTRYAMIMSSGMCIAPVFLLRPFLSLLTGKEYTADYLSELAFAGAALLVGQWFITTAVCILQILTGIGRVRFPAVVTLAWAGGGLMGVWGYLHWAEGSLLGAAVGITMARVVGCLVLLVYGIVTLQIPVRAFTTEAILAPGAVGVAVGTVGWVLSTCFDLYNIREFVLAAGVLALLYVAATWWILLSSSERYEAIGKLRPIMSKLW